MRCSDERGLTLVEMVVALALSSILLVILTDGFLNWQNQRAQVLAENELLINLNYAMGEITNDLQLAVWVVPQADSGQLVLHLENGDKIGYTLADDPIAGHPYDLQGKVLYREKNDGQRQPVANFLRQMVVSYTVETEQNVVTAVHVWLSGQARDKTVTLERTLSVGGYWWRQEKMGAGE